MKQCSQEREGETRKARLEVLERFVIDKVNDALVKLPQETQKLHQRLSVLKTLEPKANGEIKLECSVSHGA